VKPGTLVGSLCESVQRELKVPKIPVVAPSTHDTASAVAGIPVINPKRSWAFLSLGTWVVIGRETPTPLITDDVFSCGAGNEAGADGTNILAQNINGLWVVQQCRDKWMREDGTELAWDSIVRGCLEAPRLASLIDVDDPVFVAANPDMPQMVVDLCKAKGFLAPATRGEITRCIYESLVLKFRRRFEQLEGFTGEVIDHIHLVGGGAQNSSLCQWTADATGVPVAAGPVETTVAGNLLMQLKGLGLISNLAEGRSIVSRSSETRVYEPRDRVVWDEAYARYRHAFG
jgi:sugar (pentulose or hexulose) kinase